MAKNQIDIINRINSGVPYVEFLRAITSIEGIDANIYKNSIGKKNEKIDYASTLNSIDIQLGRSQDNIYNPLDSGFTEFGRRSITLGTPIGDRYVRIAPKGALTISGREETIVDLNTAIINVVKPKEVVQTFVNGLNYKVNEYVGEGNYEISIKGSFLGNFAWEYDIDTIQAFINIMREKTSIDIASNYLLDIFEINSIVILDYSLEQDETYSNVINYNITAVSDNDENIFVPYIKN